MARMLSWIARPTIAVFVLVIGTLFASRVQAQENVRASEPAVIVQNPFSIRTALPAESLPSQPPSPRGPVSFQNPFTSRSASPPLAFPLRPGPISRWRRNASLIEQPTAIANANASPAAAPFGPLPKGDPIGRSTINWDRLPPVEELAARQAIRTTTIDVPIADDNPRPPDPIGFAPSPLTQPIWMVPDLARARAASKGDHAFSGQSSVADPFEASAADGTGVRSAVADLLQAPNRSASHGDVVKAAAEGPGVGVFLNYPETLEPIDTFSAPIKVPDMLPVIVSDYVDTADGWFAQAESAAQSAKTLEDLSAVAQLCRQGLRNGPSSELAVSLRQLAAWAHNRRGELLIDARQTQPALDEFQTAISLDAECSLAIHNRAVTLAQKNRPAEAIRDFNRVIELNPGLAVAFRNRAELFSTQNRFEEAVADYGRALEQLTEDAALYRSRAYALQRLGRIDGALADLNYAIRLSPAAPESYIQRGELAVERGDFNQAVRDLHRAVQLDPNEAEAYRSLAWLLATASNPRYRDAKQALELAKEAAALSPVPDPVLLDTLAASYASAGQFDMAVDTVRQAIAIAPTDFAVPLRARLLLYQRRQPFFNLPAAGVRTAAFEEEATRE